MGEIHTSEVSKAAQIYFLKELLFGRYSAPILRDTLPITEILLVFQKSLIYKFIFDNKKISICRQNGLCTIFDFLLIQVKGLNETTESKTNLDFATKVQQICLKNCKSPINVWEISPNKDINNINSEYGTYLEIFSSSGIELKNNNIHNSYKTWIEFDFVTDGLEYNALQHLKDEEAEGIEKSPLRLRGGSAEYENLINSCHSLMHKYDDLLIKFRRSVRLCGKVKEDNFTGKSSEKYKTANASYCSYSTAQRNACGDQKDLYAKENENYNLIPEKLPFCRKLALPKLPPIHWECPDPLPSGICKNVNCPYKKKIQLLGSITSCEDENSTYSMLEPCSSQLCPLREKKLPYTTMPINKSSSPMVFHERQRGGGGGCQDLGCDSAKPKFHPICTNPNCSRATERIPYAKECPEENCPYKKQPDCFHQNYERDENNTAFMESNSDKSELLAQTDYKIYTSQPNSTPPQKCNNPNCPFQNRLVLQVVPCNMRKYLLCSNPNCPFMVKSPGQLPGSSGNLRKIKEASEENCPCAPCPTEFFQTALLNESLTTAQNDNNGIDASSDERFPHDTSPCFTGTCFATMGHLICDDCKESPQLTPMGEAPSNLGPQFPIHPAVTCKRGYCTCPKQPPNEMMESDILFDRNTDVFPPQPSKNSLSPLKQTLNEVFQAALLNESLKTAQNDNNGIDESSDERFPHETSPCFTGTCSAAMGNLTCDDCKKSLPLRPAYPPTLPPPPQKKRIDSFKYLPKKQSTTEEVVEEILEEVSIGDELDIETASDTRLVDEHGIETALDTRLDFNSEVCNLEKCAGGGIGDLICEKCVVEKPQSELSDRIETNTEIRIPKNTIPCYVETCVGGKGDLICDVCEIPALKMKKQLKKRKRRVPYVWDPNDDTRYPGVHIGHKICRADYVRVPKCQGWLWDIDIVGLSYRRGWRPGAVTKKIAKILEEHREIYQPKEKCLWCNVVPQPTLEVTKENGSYLVTAHPLKEPSTVKKFESPYMDTTPLKFRIDKPKNDQAETSSSDEGLRFSFTSPAAVIHPQKKSKMKTKEAQYDTNDFMPKKQKADNGEKDDKKGKKPQTKKKKK